MKNWRFSITIKEEIPLVCYEIYSVVTILFTLITLCWLAIDFPLLAALSSLPVVFSVWRIVQIARGKAWN